jgi:hypothetical protein
MQISEIEEFVQTRATHRRDQIPRLALAIVTPPSVKPGIVLQGIRDRFAPVSTVLPSGRVALSAVGERTVPSPTVVVLSYAYFDLGTFAMLCND